MGHNDAIERAKTLRMENWHEAVDTAMLMQIAEALQASGVSLRDKFAMQAMNAILTGNRVNIDSLANDAYRVADAMLEARRVIK